MNQSYIVRTYIKIPKRGVLSIPLMSGYASLHSMLAMGGAKSVVCHCGMRDGYCRGAQATQKPPKNRWVRGYYTVPSHTVWNAKRLNGSMVDWEGRLVTPPAGTILRCNQTAGADTSASIVESEPGRVINEGYAPFVALH